MRRAKTSLGTKAWSYFNPRTREGCDGVVDYDNLQLNGISIHAPVKGATPEQPAAGQGLADFNPRTREGCDDACERNKPFSKVFQSTHP